MGCSNNGVEKGSIEWMVVENGLLKNG